MRIVRVIVLGTALLSAGSGTASRAAAARATAPADTSRTLARIAAHRAITLDDAVARWRQERPGAPSDSITPAGVRGFLDLLVDEALLTEAAVREAAPWSPADSAAHAALRDRLVLAAALDSALAAARADAPGADAESLGVAARERVVRRLAPAFDDSACARLARAFTTRTRPSADSSLAAQLAAIARLPRFAPGDTAAVIARTTAGDVRGADVVADWLRLGIAYRPWIETPAQVRDLVANRLFERALRHDAARLALDRAPAVAAALARDAADLARRAYLRRHVLDGPAVDSATVRAFWQAHAADWERPPCARGIRLALEDRAAAVRMAATLRDGATAETLVVRAAARGADYRFTASERQDPALYARAVAAGAGAVVGPYSQGDGWWVARVTAIEPASRPGLDEVWTEVAERCRAEAAGARLDAIVRGLHATVAVDRAPRATERLTAALRAAAHPRP